GRRVAFYYWPERSDEPRRVVSMPVDGGEPTPIMDLEDEDVLKCLRWEPGGRGLYLLLRRRAATEVWRHVLPGGPSERITSFHDDRTSSFDALGRSHLVCARAEGWSDVLLVRPAHA